MAAALLQHALRAESEPLRSLKVTSAAVAGRGGEPVSENSVFALKKVGLDVSNHRSRPLTQEMLDGALAVIGMTESHRAMIHLHGAPVPGNLFLFREFMPGAVDREIGDPFGGPIRAYEAARDEMVEAIPSLVAHLKTLIAAKPA
jgi:protein-tyrosine-phosphatase